MGPVAGLSTVADFLLKTQWEIIKHAWNVLTEELDLWIEIHSGTESKVFL